MRLLLQAGTSGKRDQYLEDYIRRKALAGKSQAYKPYLIYKTATNDGQIIYRNGSAASPSTLLLEFYALDLMSKDQEFSNLTSTFSYRWPGQKSAQPWQFFFRGYKARNLAIQRALSEAPDRRVLMVDLKNFYPSTNGERCLSALDRKLHASSMEPYDRRIVRFAAERAVHEGGGSLPVGPPISHALANLFLRSVDEKLAAAFGSGYFRYVDDFAVVVDKNNIVSASDIIRDTVGELGLKVNEAKNQIVSAEDWQLLTPRDNSDPNFSDLRTMITAYLAIQPRMRDSLRSTLRDAGFNLPLDQLSYSARSVGFAAYLKSVAVAHWSYGPLKVARTNSAEIVSYAKRVREALRQELQQLASLKFEEGSFSEKWRTRKLSSTLGLMLYMYPTRQANSLSQYLSAGVEHNSIRTLINSLHSGDVTELLSYPGSTVNTFSQLWDSSEFGFAHVRWSDRIAIQQRDAVAVLALSRTIELPNEMMKAETQEELSFLGFCGEKTPKMRELSSFSYVDELRSLQIGSPPGSAHDFLLSRYDKQEEVTIEGLRLGNEYS